MLGGGLLLVAGGIGLGSAFAPENGIVVAAGSAFGGLLEMLLPHLPVEAEAADVLGGLGAAPWCYGVAPFGLALLFVGQRMGSRDGVVKRSADDEEPSAPSREDRKGMKKAGRDAARIARKGNPMEAGELCIAVGLLDEAAAYFEKAEAWERAAAIRHDQKRFADAAALYQKAGDPDSAGSIYAGQEDWSHAAEAYVQAGNLSVAAEMYEKAGDDRRAAQCFQKCDFPRYAAKAYIRCEEWLPAAECLEKVLADEATGGAGDARKQAERVKLVRMTGTLFERAGRLDRACRVLEKGGAHVAAAEIAERLGERERAAELFLEGKDHERAAAAFEALGQGERAARLRGEIARDRGDPTEAARQLERAGEWMEAGDLYRLAEHYAEAGACYERFGDGAQAAEMFNLAGDRGRAAQNYERAGLYAEAAELSALDGDAAREAELLEKAGEHLRAGRLHLEAGRIEEAIGALQKGASEDAEAANAAALLGRIFRDQQKHPLAIAKLREAIAGREIDRGSVDAFFCLATVLEATDAWSEATELYERVLAFDYHYEDTAERLERTRARVDQAQAAPTAAPAAGSGTSGRYIIRETLGRGGMGIVYKAEDTVLDRIVAFKVLPESFKENPQALKNFLREAKSAAQLNHPNIVTVYDAGEQDGDFYIAMEYVDGNTLKDIIKRRGKIAPKGILHVVSQLCEGLAFAHEKKIVHRDVKNANAMWTRDRMAKIMDFGLAKVVEEVRNHTTVVSGTPYYMSPEQTLGKNVDHRSDLYSLGVSIFEMATGTLPFTEGNLPYHHVHTEPPRPQDVEPGLPDPIARVIERCLRKDPGERYQSAREIIAELRGGSVG
jgi:tetratricopeptide (TPR) repeat protein